MQRAGIRLERRKSEQPVTVVRNQGADRRAKDDCGLRQGGQDSRNENGEHGVARTNRMHIFRESSCICPGNPGGISRARYAQPMPDDASRSFIAGIC